uniref:transposase n=1 Tax=Citrobacter sp. NCU1 TaxID=2026683 RepID=UPI001EE39437|nr:transposase [Citrobacter sp. NCU1]
MTKSVSGSKKPRKQYTPEFRNEALKLAERIGVAAAARELSLYESQLYAWRSKLKNAHSSSKREQKMAVEIDCLKRQLEEQAEEQGADVFMDWFIVLSQVVADIFPDWLRPATV